MKQLDKIIEKFDKKFIGDFRSKWFPKLIKDFIRTEFTAMENEKEPMGVSQWLEYGKKYSYDKYWLSEILKEIVPEKQRNCEIVYWEEGWNECIDEINSNIAKLK